MRVLRVLHAWRQARRDTPGKGGVHVDIGCSCQATQATIWFIQELQVLAELPPA